MSVVKLEKEKDNKTVNKSGLLIGNPVYKPFRYPWCYDAWLTHNVYIGCQKRFLWVMMLEIGKKI